MFEYSSQIKAMGLIHYEHYIEYIQRNIYTSEVLSPFVHFRTKSRTFCTSVFRVQHDSNITVHQQNRLGNIGSKQAAPIVDPGDASRMSRQTLRLNEAVFWPL
jgi:hypothetical protein